MTARVAQEQIGGGGGTVHGGERGGEDVVLVGFELADLRHGWSLSMPGGAVNRLRAIAPSTQQPPATAGRMLTVSPSATSVSSEPR